MIKYIFNFFKALNENAHPGDIGHAISFGFLLALMPKGNLSWVFLFVLTFFIRMNKGAFFLSVLLLSFLTPFLDVFIEMLGYSVLSIPFLEPLYTFLYQTPFIGLTRFNNTMVTGSFIAGAVLYVPIYQLTIKSIYFYRKTFQPAIVKSKPYQLFIRLPLVKQLVGVFNIGVSK